MEPSVHSQHLLKLNQLSVSWTIARTRDPWQNKICGWKVADGFLAHRRVWRGVQRAIEAAREERDPGRHQDLEGGLHGAAETWLPVGGVNHGPVQPPEHHPSGGGGHQKWVVVLRSCSDRKCNNLEMSRSGFLVRVGLTRLQGFVSFDSYLGWRCYKIKFNVPEKARISHVESPDWRVYW